MEPCRLGIEDEGKAFNSDRRGAERPTSRRKEVALAQIGTRLLPPDASAMLAQGRISVRVEPASQRDPISEQPKGSL